MGGIDPSRQHGHPQGVDAPAVNALLLAGIHYLVLRQRTVGSFAGIDLRQPENWRRIVGALERIANCAYAQQRRTRDTQEANKRPAIPGAASPE